MSEHKILDHDPKLGQRIDFTELISYRARKITTEAKVTYKSYKRSKMILYNGMDSKLPYSQLRKLDGTSVTFKINLTKSL